LLIVRVDDALLDKQESVIYPTLRSDMRRGISAESNRIFESSIIQNASALY
jgi:hypothetical protein